MLKSNCKVLTLPVQRKQTPYASCPVIRKRFLSWYLYCTQDFLKYQLIFILLEKYSVSDIHSESNLKYLYYPVRQFRNQSGEIGWRENYFRKIFFTEPVFYTLSFCIYEGYWWSCKSNQMIWITENDQNDSCMRKEIFICLKWEKKFRNWKKWCRQEERNLSAMRKVQNCRGTKNSWLNGRQKV